jgi:hypothetical protein
MTLSKMPLGRMIFSGLKLSRITLFIPFNKMTDRKTLSRMTFKRMPLQNGNLNATQQNATKQKVTL